MTMCLSCSSFLSPRHTKFCSNLCQADYQYQEYIFKWKANLVNGSRGIAAKNISGHLIRFLKAKYGEQCSLCKWSIRNTKTGRVPLEIDHIDGNSENNCESNLRLICPNCHSLTDNFRNLNKGKGRDWRRLKYNKN